ncbi:glycosyltransferase family 4 protein [Lactobacillus acidophilus]
MKKKVCIVIPPNLPMPAVKGGAIETLLQYVIDLNEKNKDCNLTVISLYDKKAEKVSQKYKYTKFVYYHPQKGDNVKYFLFRGFRKACRLQLTFLEPYENFVNQYVLKNDFDIFVNESADFKAFRKISKKMGKTNCYAHLHSVFSSTKLIDETFGTIISVSDYIKQNWEKSSTIDPASIKVLRNCADKRIFSKALTTDEKNTLRNKLGLDKKDFIVIFSGRIIKEKGILELIKAIKKIKNPTIKLLIIGSPNFGKKTITKYQNQVIKEVNSSNGKIIFTGFVSHDELYKYYSIAQCAVVPSVYEDPAPLVPIEAMMAKKPLIVTNSGGIVEYVNSKSSILVKKEKNLISQLTKSILKIYSSPSLQQTMSKEAGIRASQYTVENYYFNYLKILGIK